MRRYAGWIAIVLLLFIGVVALAAYGRPAGTQSLADRARAVESQLRCPVCQGESVAVSPSGLAGAMRSEIRRQLHQGRSESQIKAYFVARYGDWILLSPPASGIGDLAWLAPPLLSLGGLALVATLVLGWRRTGTTTPATVSPYLDRVRAELADSERGG